MPNFERLRRCYKLIASIPEQDIKMDFWKCGTSACAVGWMASSSEANEEGLFLRRTGDAAEPVFGHYESWGAVCEYFDLRADTAEWIFGGYSMIDGEHTERVKDDFLNDLEKYLRRHNQWFSLEEVEAMVVA